MSFRQIEPSEGDYFVVSRNGDVDIELTGVHLAQLEEVDDGEDYRGRLLDGCSLYRTMRGRYVISYYGGGTATAVVLESPQALLGELTAKRGYLSEFNKRLLNEAAKRDEGIAGIARLDLRNDYVRELALSINRASEVIDATHLHDHIVGSSKASKLIHRRQ